MNTFTPKMTDLGQLQERSQEEIKNEPMLFSADLQFAKDNGGPLTEEFLSFLDPNKDWIIDTRVHMLMEGWYPCIGGWHADNIPRNTENGQPNYKNPPYISNLILGIVDAGTDSLTEFLSTDVTLPDPPDDLDTPLYGYWSTEINRQLDNGEIKSIHVPNRKVMGFDSFTFHRGIPAKSFGWRFFIRATTDTPQIANNEIRRQVNTYIPAEGGW